MFLLILFITGPPARPEVVLISINCDNTVSVSWSRSDGARFYTVNMNCGTDHVIINFMRNRSSLGVPYNGQKSHCMASVSAGNPAGNSSATENRTSLFKGAVRSKELE